MRRNDLRLWGLYNSRTGCVEFSDPVQSRVRNMVKLLPLEIRRWYEVIRFDIAECYKDK